MKHLWTWGGEYFGYRRGNELRTHTGKCVGRFYGDEIYGNDGRYLGEIRNSNRLITKRSRKKTRKSSLASTARAASVIRRVRYVRNVMVAGYEDFPNPEDF